MVVTTDDPSAGERAASMFLRFRVCITVSDASRDMLDGHACWEGVEQGVVVPAEARGSRLTLNPEVTRVTPTHFAKPLRSSICVGTAGYLGGEENTLS